MAEVEVRGITKYFGEVKVLDNVNLATRKHEFLVLLGPSGCGKTTLLRIIAGLEKPTIGEILIGGGEVTGLPPRARNIAMVPQSYALYPHMTVLENISFPLRARKVNKDAIQEKVAWAASLFGIERLLKRKPRELSGGERQRVALARAIVRMPAVFLLDEPLSNLDAKLRTSAREELQAFQKRLGITTIYVTHDQVEAMGLGNRVVVMDGGRVRQIGTPLEVYREPADTFVATFVGSPPMNLVEQGGVLMGFRPEEFLPLEVRWEDEDLERFQFEVTWVENLGADRLVYGTMGFEAKNGRVVSRLAQNVKVALEAGKTYTFTVPRHGINLFDRNTGMRLAGRPEGGG